MDKFPRTAVYPGSFDPPTKGHLDVLQRAPGLFDRVVVGIGRNPEKDSLLSAEERVELMTSLRPDGVDVVVEAYEGLTVDFAKKHQAVALIRGFGPCRTWKANADGVPIALWPTWKQSSWSRLRNTPSPAAV